MYSLNQNYQIANKLIKHYILIEDNIELKKNLSLIVAFILNATFIYSQVKTNSNTTFDNSDRDFFSIPKLIIYLNYFLCFFNTFIVFFNKKKYQLIHAKLDVINKSKKNNILNIFYLFFNLFI